MGFARIGVFAPSSPVSDSENRIRLSTAIRRLGTDGFRVYLAENVFIRRGHSAGTVKQRVSAFNSMLADKRISLMLAANGGIGSYEMMDKVDYRLIKKSKKPVMGLSDVSALLNSINAKTGVITYHGPTLCYGIVHPNNPRRIEPRTYAEFISFLRHGCKEIKPAKKYRVLRKGTGKGVLAGGNLYVFSGLIGTPYINRGRLVLFFEDVGIDVADVKRAMYQLKGSGVLDRTEGMILGHFEGITRRGAGCGIACLEKSIMEAIKGYDFPVLSGAMFGHDSPNTIIPVGAKAEVSNEVGLLTRIGGVL